MTRQSKWRLRSARIEDAAQIAGIYRQSVLTSPATFEEVPPSASEFAARIETSMARHPWLVALNENDYIAGYASGSEHKARSAYRWSVNVSVYLDEAYQGFGLGSALYEKLLAELTAQNFCQAYAGITNSNLPSIRLHEKFGFKLAGLFSNVGYKFGCWHDVGWWQRELSPALKNPVELLPPRRFDSAR